jgi:putative ABC transport system substrate-binding protein
MSSAIRRRAFLTLVGGAVIAVPLVARAQPKLPVAGFLSGEPHAPWMHEFVRGLSEIGWVEGRNVTVERRFAGGQPERLPGLAAELIDRNVQVIAAAGIPSLRAARSAHTTVPVVFTMSGDPVKLGLVDSLHRPGGNVTGVTTLGVEVGPKRLELLHELIPGAKVFAALVNPANPGAGMQSNALQGAARGRGLTLHVLHASTGRDIDNAFATARRLRVDGFVVGTNALFNTYLAKLAALGRNYRIPTIFQNREFTAAGGLMSYGGTNAEAYRQLGAYVGRILKGEKPANLPVQQATRVRLIINLAIANSLGLAVPTTLLARADEVIE